MILLTQFHPVLIIKYIFKKSIIKSSTKICILKMQTPIWKPLLQRQLLLKDNFHKGFISHLQRHLCRTFFYEFSNKIYYSIRGCFIIFSSPPKPHIFLIQLFLKLHNPYSNITPFIQN